MFSAPSPPRDDSAARLRAQEEARQAKIREGRAAIDTAFDQFDDDFYGQRETAYSGYYMPQLEDRYQDAYRQMVLNLSRSGNLNAGAGARQLGDLKEAYDTRRTEISDRAIESANDARSRIESARGELYSQNATAADPGQASSAAQARVGALSAPQAFSPLGNVFAEFINSAANAVAAERAGYPGWNTGLFDSATPKERVIG